MANFNTALTLLSNSGAGNGSAVAWPGGAGLVTGEATWGGGNIKLQIRTTNGTWVDVSASAHTLSANGTFAFTLPRCQMRMVVTTSTAAYAYAHGTAEP